VAQLSHAGFDAATLEIWGALLNGGWLVLVPRETELGVRRGWPVRWWTGA